MAHYRLAQAYLRTGNKARAQQELQLHEQLAKKTKEHIERERREIQQFVISLRNTNSVSQPQDRTVTNQRAGVAALISLTKIR